MKLRTLLTLLVTAAGAAGCGGGSDQDQAQAQGPQQSRQLIASAVQAAAAESAGTTRRQIAAVTAAAEVDPAVEAKALFDFAEAQFPHLFPSHRPDMAVEDWRYRFYPETGIFLVVADGRVYVLGGPFGDQVRYVGLAQDVLNPPSSVVVTVSAPASGKAAWNIAAPMKFTLVDTAGMAVSGPFSCTSDAPAAIEVASDCSTITGRRLGTQTISVTNGSIVGKASIKVIPQAQPFGTGGNARYNLIAMPDGRALSWGPVDAPLGQGQILGNSIGVFLPTPVKVPGTSNDALTGVVAVAAGEQQAFALTEDGEVYSWGAAPGLGRQTTSGDTRPGKVVDTTGQQPLKRIVAISTGGTNALALGDDGTVYAWGEATGVAGGEPRKVPVVVPGGKAVAIASGYLWNAALLTEGYVATWGRNIDGATGQGSALSGTLAPALVLEELGGKPLSGIVSISAGEQHGFALGANGIAYGWGRNMLGQLGRGDRGTVARKAVPVTGPGGGANWTGLRMVAAGGNHSLGLDSGGRVYSWGYSASGELGDGLTSPRSEAAQTLPGPVLAATGTDQLSNAVAIGAGHAHSFALLSDGRMMIWGSGFNGILGQGGSSTARSTIPLPVKNETGATALSLNPLSAWPNLERRMR
jgi:alpha-tubulin suppressor-like RCC1 family protein